MDVAVIGAGAVGLAVGASLHAAGVGVVFVTRPQAYEALRRDGARRTGLFGDAHLPAGSLRALSSVADLTHELALDFVLGCVKTSASRELAAELGRIWPELAGAPRLVLFQNGWGSADLFAARVPARRVFSARVITGFRRLPGSVSEVTVHADSIRAGSLFGADPQELQPLCRALARGGLPCEVSDDVSRDLWAKLLYNCALNPLSALLGVPYGVLAETERTRCVMDCVVREVFAVMDAAQFGTEWSTSGEYLETLFTKLLPPTASHESSMLQDLREGRPTEVDALSGAVADLGATHGIDTPVNEALRTLIHAAE